MNGNRVVLGDLRPRARRRPRRPRSATRTAPTSSMRCARAPYAARRRDLERGERAALLASAAGRAAAAYVVAARALPRRRPRGLPSATVEPHHARPRRAHDPRSFIARARRRLPRERPDGAASSTRSGTTRIPPRTREAPFAEHPGSRMLGQGDYGAAACDALDAPRSAARRQPRAGQRNGVERLWYLEDGFETVGARRADRALHGPRAAPAARAAGARRARRRGRARPGVAAPRRARARVLPAGGRRVLQLPARRRGAARRLAVGPALGRRHAEALVRARSRQRGRGRRRRGDGRLLALPGRRPRRREPAAAAASALLSSPACCEQSSSTSTSRSPVPGPDLGPDGYRQLGLRYGLDLDPARYEQARAAAFAEVKRHPELDHDEEIWVLFTERIIVGMGGTGRHVRGGGRDGAALVAVGALRALRRRAAGARRAARARPEDRAALELVARPRRVRRAPRARGRRRADLARPRQDEAARDDLPRHARPARRSSPARR